MARVNEAERRWINYIYIGHSEGVLECHSDNLIACIRRMLAQTTREKWLDQTWTTMSTGKPLN